MSLFQEEILTNTKNYCEVLEKRCKALGEKHIIITSNVCASIEFYEDEFYVYEYAALPSRQLFSSKTNSYKEITPQVLLDLINPDRHHEFSQSSNFINKPYEANEILYAMRLINAILGRIYFTEKVKNKTITNVFPSCEYSEISFEIVDNHHIAVNIKVEKYNTSKEEVFKIDERIVIKYGTNFIVELYDLFMKHYWKF